MPEWSTACPDWEDRITSGRSIIPCGPLFKSEADEALEVFKALRVVDVPGAPTVGEIARPWILDFAAAFFGAYDPESGKRLIRTYYLKVPKKNWKSGITAFLMGTLLIRNWRESGEFGIIAPTTEVANNAFGPLKHAIRKDEELSDLLLVQDHIRTITHRTTKATLQVVAAESDTVSGKKFIVTLVEELWQFGKRANADGMLMEATGGMASRDEGAVIYITTESDDPPAGVYAAKNTYARKVRDGEIVDPTFLPVLYEWPTHMVKSKAYMDISNAGIVNPNLGASVSTEWMRASFEEKKAESERAFQTFLAKHLNVEVGLALRSERWVGADYWERCADPALTLDDVIAASDVLEVGIDFGGADDWFALCVLGRHATTGAWLHWCKSWAHTDAFERRKSEAARWRDFIAQGDLVEVAAIDDQITEAVSIVMQCESTGLLDKVAVDTYKVQSLDDALTEAGFDRERIVGIPQGWKLIGAIYAIERKLAAGKFRHGGRPIMAYAIGNAKAVPKGNNIAIEKQTAGASKIDPVLALFHAASALSMAPAQNVIGSDYELTTA